MKTVIQMKEGITELLLIVQWWGIITIWYVSWTCALVSHLCFSTETEDLLLILLYIKLYIMYESISIWCLVNKALLAFPSSLVRGISFSLSSIKIYICSCIVVVFSLIFIINRKRLLTSLVMIRSWWLRLGW